MPFPFSGTIEETPLPNILEELHKRQATGVLTVREPEGAVKSVHLKGGQIVFASSTDSGDRLGEILVRAGLLSREHLEVALRQCRAAAGFKKFGAVLVENKFVSPKDLFTGLKTQVKDIVFSLFLIPGGAYQFSDDLPADTIQLQLNLHELIGEIIRRIRQEA